MRERTLYLVRHGQSSGNLRGAFLGHQDPPLTELGLAQAERLASKLDLSSVSTLWCSPLTRACQTAAVLTAFGGGSVTVEPALIEQDFGRWDGLTPDEAARHFPEDFERWRTGSPRIAPTGGESLEQVAHRVHAFFNALERRSRERTLIWVSHACVIQVTLCLLLKTPLCNFWPYRVETGSFARISWGPDGAFLDCLNRGDSRP